MRINGKIVDINEPGKPFVTGLVDLKAIHSIYLTSTKIGNYGNFGPGGQRNVLKKIVTGNTGFGDVYTSTDLWENDKVDVPNLSFKLLDFQLKDVFGNIIDLNISHVSFSLCLTQG